MFGTISHLSPFDTDSKIEEIFSLLASGITRGGFWTNPKLNLRAVKSKFARSDRKLQDLIRITLEERARSEGRSRFGDKTPSNLTRLKTLIDWFPDSKFLHITRDPRAVFISEINRKSRQHYRFKKINVITKFMIFLYICHDWKRNISLSKKYSKQYPENYLLVRFRLLYTEFEKEVKRICEFIRVDFEQSMFDPPRRASNLSKDYDPLNGWRKKISGFYDFLFRLLLGRRINSYF